MNFKTTLVLLVLLLGVGATILFTRESGEPEDKPKEEPKKLLALTGSDVQAIAITPAGEKKILLRRDGLGWNIAEPFVAEADPVAVNTLLGDLTRLESQRSTAVSEGTGLQQP